MEIGMSAPGLLGFIFGIVAYLRIKKFETNVR